MSYIQNVYPIQSRDAIARDVFDYVVACPDIASQSHAGQFVHIRVGRPYPAPGPFPSVK